jgi:small subunit ribosomal protein S20
MANLKSSIKDVRRTKTRTVRNQDRVTRIDTAIRAVTAAATAEDAQKALKECSALLDRAAKAGLLHWRTVSRKKSRLTRIVSAKFPPAKK